MKIGIMGAMAEEISQFRHHMSQTRIELRGMREYATGQLRGRSVTVVFSRWGKVAASSTATTLVERHGVDFLIFTGMAGAIAPNLNIGDMVVADTLVQHDMDASMLPGIARYEIPLLGISRFKAESHDVRAARRAAETYLKEDLRGDVSSATLQEFQIAAPRVSTGTVASGDQFVADESIVQRLREQLPGLKCVEMEGAAVAQVAHEHSIPCLVLRTISDKADHSAVIDFPRFAHKVASHFTCGAVLRLFESIGH